MKWFRHHTAISSHNTLSKIKNDLGAERYGQFWFINETVGNSMDTDKSSPEATLSENTWINNLNCKTKKNLDKILFDLQGVGAIDYTKCGADIKIKVPILKEMADSRAVSSFKRAQVSSREVGPNSDPRVEDRTLDYNKLESDNNILNEYETKTTKDQIRTELDYKLDSSENTNIPYSNETSELSKKRTFGQRTPAKAEVYIT